MINISNKKFHEIVASGNYKSRLRLYSIDLANNPIDVGVQSEVEEYGTLLKYNPTDTDSNGRIGQSGIIIRNYFNKDEQVEIGKSVSCGIELTLINDDSFFSTYDWTQTIIIYFDVYNQAQGSSWITCPLGVYWWERPTKTSSIIVEAKAYDAMTVLGDRLDFDWSGYTWSDGVTLGTIYNDVVGNGNISGIIPDTDFQNGPNASVTYFVEPFSVDGMSRREVLEKIAEACGGIAQVSRNGRVRVKFFTDAKYNPSQFSPLQFYVLNGDSGPTPILSIDIGEYTVPVIDHVIATISQTGQTFDEPTLNPGAETLYIYDNGFLTAPWATSRAMVQTILGVVSGQHPSSNIVPYVPISIRTRIDPTIESGDIIEVIRNGTTYYVPIFSQKLTWRGGEWTAEIQCNGYANRQIPSASTRSVYRATARSYDESITSASIDSSGLVSFDNSQGTTKFTLQLPVYNGGVS